MRQFSTRPVLYALAIFGLPTLVWGTSSGGDEEPYDGFPAFEFSDSFYIEEGIDPSVLLDRLVGQDGRSVSDSSPSGDFLDVRILETTGGYDHKGKPLYYTTNAKLNADAFLTEEARELADESIAYIFPKAAGNPLVPATPNTRQPNVFDTRHGYFSNNPLGLWRVTFVSYTDAAFNTEDGQEALAELAEENGLDSDGTPLIRRVNEIEDLAEDGFVEIRVRNEDGSEGFPWVV